MLRLEADHVNILHEQVYESVLTWHVPLVVVCLQCPRHEYRNAATNKIKAARKTYVREPLTLTPAQLISAVLSTPTAQEIES